MTQGAVEKPVSVASGIDSQIFVELQKKGVVVRTGFTRGPGGSRGNVKIVVDPYAVEEGRNRAPKGSTTPGAPGRAIGRGMRGQHKQYSPADMKRFLEAITPAAKQSFEQRKHQALTRAEIDRATKGLEGADYLDAVDRLRRMKDQTFPEYLAEQFGQDLLDIIDWERESVDTPDPKPPRR